MNWVRGSLFLSTLGWVVLGAGAHAADTSGVAPAAVPAATPAAAPASPPAAPSSPPFSVMFTPEEIKAIDQAFFDRDHPLSAQASAQTQATVTAAAEALRPRIPNIYVSAVLDFGGGEWTVWANGLRVTPDQQSPLFKVVSVRGNTVDISVTSDGGTRISLQPYQTWRSRQRDVVEGIFP